MNRTLRQWKRLAAVLGFALAGSLAGCARSAQAPSTSTPSEEEEQASEPAEERSPAPRTGTTRSEEGKAYSRATQPRPAPRPPVQETVRKTVPPGTMLQLALETDLATDANAAGDRFEARVTEPVIIDNLQVIPTGSVVEGVLSAVQPAKKLTGGASMTLSFREIRLPGGQRSSLVASLTSEGARSGKKSAAIIGGSAAGGALLGKVIGKDTKDAAIGSIIGGAIGAGVAASRDKELRLPAGTTLTVMTEEPLQLPVKVRVEG